MACSDGSDGQISSSDAHSGIRIAAELLTAGGISTLIVGDSIQVKIKGDNLWFIVGKHSPDKNPIVRRERIPPDGAPRTCAN